MIVALLAILVFSYCQVIDAYPGGGGAYAVSRDNFGPRGSLLAAAALIVDYTLTVAVSIAAGVASLTSAFPGLSPETVPICLGILAVVTLLNLRGLADAARAFLLPTMLFIVGLLVIIVIGLIHPLALHAPQPGRSLLPAHAVEAVSVLLLLKAFSAGCSALTGVEAIANGVPLFKQPRVARAKQTELLLGGILGAMLLGLAVLADRWHVGPRSGQTVLSQIIATAVGRHWAYYVISLTITVVLALAANTSFGGLPVLASLVAKDDYLPRLFSLRDDRQVFASGHLGAGRHVGGPADRRRRQHAAADPAVRHRRLYRLYPGPGRNRGALAAQATARLAAARWITDRRPPPPSPQWYSWSPSSPRERGWSCWPSLPSSSFSPGSTATTSGSTASSSIGAIPGPPQAKPVIVVVPVVAMSRLTQHVISEALSISQHVIAVTVVTADPDLEHRGTRESLRQQWDRWNPGVPLQVLHTQYASMAGPIVTFIDKLRVQHDQQIVVLIPVVRPDHLRDRLLHNQIDVILTRALRTRTDIIQTRVTIPLESRDDGACPRPRRARRTKPDKATGPRRSRT